MIFLARHEAAGKRILLGDGRKLPATVVEDVMVGARQVLDSHLAGCHLVLVSPDLSISLDLVHR